MHRFLGAARRLTGPARRAPPPPRVQIVGEHGAELLGGSGYIVGPPWSRREPIVDTLTKQEGALALGRRG